MSFQPVSRARVADQVSESIRSAIIGGKYRPGDRLPSERDLAAQFGVNRSSVREALHGLEAHGLVEVHHGGGVVVQDVLGRAGLQMLPWLLAPKGNINQKMLADLLQLRVGLLGFAAGLAAQNADDEDIARLDGAIRAIEIGQSGSELQRADHEFFEALVDATGNQVLLLVVNTITAAYEQNQETFSALYPADMDAIFHRTCLIAIGDGDEAAAVEAMRSYALMGLLAMESAQAAATDEPGETP